jgi:hypothetical protein
MKPRSLCAILSLSLAVVSCSESTSPEKQSPAKPRPTVNAKISCGEYVLQVENMDTNIWDNIDMYVNGQPPDDAYHYHLGVLQPDHPYKIQLRDFIKQDGRTRFNPEEKVTVVWIGGGDYDFRAYRF